MLVKRGGAGASIEHFNPKEVELSDQDGSCRVYYTNSIKACKDGVLDPSIEYYKNKLNKLTSRIRGGRVPTRQERSDIAKYTRLLADYEEIRSKTGSSACSIELPGWKTNADGPFLGAISRNANRGDAPHWAYCYKKDVSAQMKTVLQSAGFKIDELPESPGVTRIAFSNGFPYEQTKAAYCEETKNSINQYALGTGFFIKNVLGKGVTPTVQFFKDGNPKTIDLNDIYSMFDNRFFTQQTRTVGGYELLEVVPTPLNPCRVKRIRTNACGKKVLVSTGQGGIQFKKRIVLKRVPTNTAYLKGTIPDLKARLNTKRIELNSWVDTMGARIRDMILAQNVIRDRWGRINNNNWVIGLRRGNIDYYNRFTYNICRWQWERC